MPSIPKPSHVPLSPQEIAKLHDYKKKWLEAVRSDTTKHKFSTLPIGLYESEPPPNVDFNLMSFFRGRDATTQAAREKVIFYKGSAFFRTEEEEMLIVANEDVNDGTREVSAEVFTQDKEDCLQFNWQGTETSNLECYTTTSILFPYTSSMHYCFLSALQQTRAEHSRGFYICFMTKNPIISPRIRLNFQTKPFYQRSKNGGSRALFSVKAR